MLLLFFRSLIVLWDQSDGYLMAYASRSNTYVLEYSFLRIVEEQSRR